MCLSFKYFVISVFQQYIKSYLVLLCKTKILPNYCYRCGNLAAIVKLDEKMELHVKTFEAAPAKDC